MSAFDQVVQSFVLNTTPGGSTPTSSEPPSRLPEKPENTDLNQRFVSLSENGLSRTKAMDEYNQLGRNVNKLLATDLPGDSLNNAPTPSDDLDVDNTAQTSAGPGLGR